jgi:hypothetical protein
MTGSKGEGAVHGGDEVGQGPISSAVVGEAGQGLNEGDLGLGDEGFGLAMADSLGNPIQEAGAKFQG